MINKAYTLLPLSMGNMSHVDPTGNTVSAIVRLKDCSLMLTSIYLPPNNEHTKLASMYHVANIHGLIKCPWAIFGDFNMTPCELVAMDWTIVSRGTIHCADVTRTVNQRPAKGKTERNSQSGPCQVWTPPTQT